MHILAAVVIQYHLPALTVCCNYYNSTRGTYISSTSTSTSNLSLVYVQIYPGSLQEAEGRKKRCTNERVNYLSTTEQLHLCKGYVVQVWCVIYYTRKLKNHTQYQVPGTKKSSVLGDGHLYSSTVVRVRTRTTIYYRHAPGPHEPIIPE